ncbi:amidohydrolase [Lentibacillus salinarum]|uniref:Amidohydrolase n=1 Tax=Lentibacillus salinarum TaxID=446820 RepID=A0ABW3ZU69_9BACI
MSKTPLDMAKEMDEELIDFRRKLHRDPELSEEEFKTQEKIIEKLEAFGIAYEKVGKTSTIATIKGKGPGKTVALRGDIDALPIQEDLGLDFESKNEGVMHACGHDGHATMALGAAKILQDMKYEFNGEVRVFFQEAEETFKGAEKIVADGGMKGVDAVFGTHNYPTLPSGTFFAGAGDMLSGCDTIYVTFTGESGHGGTPQLGKDSFTPGAQFALDLQHIIAKNTDSRTPVVLNVGRFTSGSKANIVPRETSIDISMRYFDMETREVVHESIKRHAKALADMYEIDADVTIEQSTLPTINDEKLADIAANAGKTVFGEDQFRKMDRVMNSEDFSYYTEEAPGVYGIIGAYNEAKGTVYSPHNDRYQLDESILVLGTAWHVAFATAFLQED